MKSKITDLVHDAKTAFNSAKIKASKTCKQLFQNFNFLLGKKKTSPVPSNVDPTSLPSVFSDYFADKILTIRSHFPPSDHSDESVVYSGKHFESFSPVSEQTVLEILKETAAKSCELDPIPTTLLYENLDILLPSITQIINSSLTSGTVPDQFKIAVVKPLLKSPTLDKNDLKNYRPISNLSFLSKVLEKAVLRQLHDHLQTNNLCNPFQSAYRSGCSTETALLRVVNDLLMAMDEDKISVLLLLDLSAAFDTVDHNILISRLETVFGLRSTVLDWFKSYLHGRQQFVSVNNVSSPLKQLFFGVPQGSVLGPALFVLYTTPLSDIIAAHHSVSHQLFADDTQLHTSTKPENVEKITTDLKECTDDIKTWMNTNQLKLNDGKTEALLFTPPNLSPSCPLPSSATVGSHTIPFTPKARNLGFVVDSQLSFSDHVTKVCQTAYFELKRISSIRRHLTDDATKTLVTSCVLSRLDYCNSLLIGSDQSVIQPMQKVQNAAARLVLKSSRHQPCTPLLRQLHWLPISERIRYKVACFCFNFFTGSSPSYLSELLQQYTPSRSLRSSTDTRLLRHKRFKRKKHGHRSFSCNAPELWNSLPKSVRHCPSAPSFKSKLKTYLFSQYNK